jgi:hypothetical protein
MKYINTDERKFVFQLAWIVIVVAAIWLVQHFVIGGAGVIRTDMLVIGGSAKHPAKIIASVEADGDPTLIFYDANGKSLLDIWASNRGGIASLTFHGVGGKPTLVIEVVPATGKPRIRFVDPVTGQTTSLPVPSDAPMEPKAP